LLALAQVHVKNNEPYKAMNDYTLIITNSRFSPGYYRERAMVKLQIKDTTGALADFNQAIGLDAREPNLFYGRAQIYMMRHAFEEAIQDLAKAEELDPKSSRYPFQRGLAMLAMGQVSKASTQFAVARKNNASSDEMRTMASQAWSRYEIGQTQARPGQLQQALATLNDALSLNPELVEAALEKGKVLMKMLDFATAEASLSEALEVRRTYNPVRVARSTTRLALKNTEGALQDCMTALQFEAQNYLALIALAEVYMAQDRMPDAQDQFKKAENLYPEQPNAYLAHARALIRAGLPDKADGLLDKALKYSKDNQADALLAQAEHALRKHDYKEAQKLAEKSLKSGLILADALLVKGYATVLAGDAKGGLSQILSVADKDPDQYYPQALILGAEAYLKLGQPNRAHQLLDKMQPSRRAYLAAAYYTALGNTRFASDSLAEAKVAYTAAQAADDTYAPAQYGLARCAARAKDADLALRLLKECLRTKPLPKEAVQDDAAFAGFKEDKRFRSIIRDIY
jgi:tetratricopeptide (TPR) repeat protein